PSQWYGTWRLEPLGDGTKVTFTEATLGHVSDAGQREKTSGWEFLSACLKAHLQGDSKPAMPG
ncbi:MAG: hypothetical protein AAGA45_03075, partial [Verrucomicrobiota bacterium]